MRNKLRLLPPLPVGEGTGIRRLVIYPLSLWERAGVRVPFASRPGPHPHPLPRGEGTGIRRLGIYPLSLWERAGVRVPFASRPGPHPHPLPRGEGTGIRRLVIYPLSLWERAGVRVPFASRPGPHPHPLPRGEGTGIRWQGIMRRSPQGGESGNRIAYRTGVRIVSTLYEVYWRCLMAGIGDGTIGLVRTQRRPVRRSIRRTAPRPSRSLPGCRAVPRPLRLPPA